MSLFYSCGGKEISCTGLEEYLIKQMRVKVWLYFVIKNGFSFIGHSNYSFET
ncbi:unnamed protein product [Blumeria hordei]|uniref:Uncharacterized protein n=1 Tax=Blumeria hordei TaxID=2867405 RepID=A0A383ULZ8_BLUHO|nr:unnamed protein product [Blumeria hordei]